MCAGAAHAARIDRLVYTAPDPKAGYAGTLHDTPADARLNHTIAVENAASSRPKPPNSCGISSETAAQDHNRHTYATYLQSLTRSRIVHYYST